jgi:hypothetical protein
MTRNGLRRRVARAERDAGRTDLQFPVAEQTTSTSDAGILAGEMAAAFGQLIDGLKEHYKASALEATAKADELCADADAFQRALHCPPDQVSWIDLLNLEESDPALALRRWEEVKGEARAELRSGHRAARALESYGNGCWGRAQFLAVRAELVEAWRPRDAQELQLIDQMAQFQTLMERWQGTVNAYTEIMGTNGAARYKRDVELPRVRDAEAVEGAARMVERFQRLYLRALQALQALQVRRRAVPPVVIGRAEQVNVAAQQINVGGRG